MSNSNDCRTDLATMWLLLDPIGSLYIGNILCSFVCLFVDLSVCLSVRSIFKIYIKQSWVVMFRSCHESSWAVMKPSWTPRMWWTVQKGNKTGLEDGRTLDCISYSFPGTLTYLLCLEKCWNSSPMCIFSNPRDNIMIYADILCSQDLRVGRRYVPDIRVNFKVDVISNREITFSG